MKNKLEQIIFYARENGCSDLHLQENHAPILRRNGELFTYPIELPVEEIKDIIECMMDEKQKEILSQGMDLDFSYVSRDQERQRVNIYYQQGLLCAALRIIANTIRTLDELRMPDILKKLAMQPRGLVLVTGPTGSGKSTTLAAVMQYINEHRKVHILTIEDPIEYVYEWKKSIIHQREIGADVKSFDMALRSAMREDPDVILVGEMRDYETIAAVITLAETGHLVFSTLHTIGAAKTIDRIIDVFPSEKQAQIRMQLAGVLSAVITQQLLPTSDAQGRVPALEILIGTDAVSNMIREGKVHQINSLIQTGEQSGMQALNFALAKLVRTGNITRETAFSCSEDPRELEQYLM